MPFKYVDEEVYFTRDKIIKLEHRDVAFLKEKAEGNGRKRVRLCTHQSIEDKVHEMFIVHKKNTYVHPHKHLNKIESFHIIEGIVDIILFDEMGTITEVIRMGEYLSGNKFYYRISGPTYHTLLIRSHILVFHETTSGPFNRGDTIFAPWAPDESDEIAAGAFMDKLSILSCRRFKLENSFYQRETCRLCGSKKIEMVLPLTPSPLCDAYVAADRLNIVQDIYPLDLFLCRDCGYVFMPYVVDPELRYRDYIYVTTSSMGLSDHFQRYAEAVIRRITPSPGSIAVDIGSNDGTLLSFFQKQGIRVIGVEPATEIANKVNDAGIETLPEFFTSELADKIKREYGTASIVTMNNLFANIDNLREVTEGVCKLLADDGVFIIESSYLADMITNMVFDFIYHEHLSYLSVKPLDKFFRCLNMELFDIERVPTKGGSLRYYIQPVGGHRPVSQSVGELIAYEKKIGLDGVEIYKTFSEKIDDRKNKIVTKLRELKAKGKTIAGYGASATSTTLIYHLGIGEMMDYIVDDNPTKHHTFSPGYHIPVLPSDVIYERKPDVVIMLAWRYLEPIVKKHQAYLDQGGQIIRPLPEFEIIRN